MLGIGRFRKAEEPATKLKFNPAASAKHDPTRLWIHTAASGNSTRSDPPKLNPPSSHVSRSTSKALCICQGIFMNPNKLSWRPAKTDGRRSDHNCVRSLLPSLTVQLSMNLSELTQKKKKKKKKKMRARMKPSPLPLQQTTADESATIYTLVLELQVINAKWWWSSSVVVSDLQVLLRTWSSCLIKKSWYHGRQFGFSERRQLVRIRLC